MKTEALTELVLEKLEHVEISHIFRNESLDWFPEELDASEKAQVLEQPSLMPWVVQSQEGGNRFMLVDGYRRLRSLKAMGIKQGMILECRIIPAQISLGEILFFRLQNLPASKRKGLSGNQSTKILSRFHQSGFSVQELSEKVLPWLGEPASQHRANRMLQLGNMLGALKLPESMQKMTLQELMPLLRFSAEDLPSLLELARLMTPGGNKWKTMLQLIDENCRIRRVKAHEFLKDGDCRTLLNNPDLQGPVLYRRFKQLLERQRNPELERLREQFEEFSRELKLPERVVMKTDAFFEKEEMTLTMKASSLEELSLQLEKLRNLLEKPELKQIFQLLKG